MPQGHLIGLVGRAGSGKDTAAAALIPLGYHRVAFADALKQAAYAADPIIDCGDSQNARVTGRARLALLVQLVGWDHAKRDYPDVRGYLQRLGCAMRDVMPGCWIGIGMAKAAENRARGINVVVTDVRFDDEVDAIRAAGGYVVRIDRPGGTADGDSGHVSEQVERLMVDIAVQNNGTIDDLAQRIRIIAQSLERVPA